MNELYTLIMDGAIEPFNQILMIVLFMIVFEGLMSIIIELIRIARR